MCYINVTSTFSHQVERADENPNVSQVPSAIHHQQQLLNSYSTGQCSSDTSRSSPCEDVLLRFQPEYPQGSNFQEDQHEANAIGQGDMPVTTEASPISDGGPGYMCGSTSLVQPTMFHSTDVTHQHDSRMDTDDKRNDFINKARHC